MNPEEYARQLRRPQGDDALATTARMEALNGRFYEQVQPYLPPYAPFTLLEIGPGNGAHAVPWLKALPGLQYRALDYSQEVIALWKKRLEPWAERCSASCGDARDAGQYRAASCDILLSVNTIYFMDDLPALFRLWHHALQPDGRLILGFRPASVMRQFPFSAHGFRLHEAEAVAEALRESGFHKETTLEFEDDPREVAGKLVPVSGYFWVYKR